MAKKKPTVLQDFGEKIGGARKDLAVKKGPREPKGEVDTRPGWQKRFRVTQIAADSASKMSPAMRSYYGHSDETGKFVIEDTRTKDWRGNHKRATNKTFATQAEAEAHVPMLAVSQKHYVRSNYARTEDGKIDANKSTYEIWRKVTDKKQVKASSQQFETREHAMAYMAENAAKLLTEGKGFGEEIRPKPEKVYRHGPETHMGVVDPKKFLSEFGFRGVEFGNWQGERQQVVDHAYSAMRDLAEVTGFSEDVVGNRLGLAFGARGHGGKNAAAAHYEPARKAINLTKISGAGTLAHEWWHATDHMLGNAHKPEAAAKPITKGYEGDSYASHMTSAKGSLHPKVVDAYKDVMDSLYHKTEIRAIDLAPLETRVEATRERLKSQIKSVRDSLTRELTYKTRGGKPATEAQLKRFDEIADKLVRGEDTALQHRWNDVKGPSRRNMSGRWTNDTLDALNAIHKEVRGSTGFGDKGTGPINYVGSEFNSMKGLQDQIAKARENPSEVVKKPTDYFRAAKNLDEARSESYWTTKHEMSARAFEAYVFDKLKEAGRRSDYLVYGVSNDQYQHLGDSVHPYPGGDERAMINAKFDKLMAAMRETGTVKPAASVGIRGWTQAARDASLKVRQENAQSKAPAAIEKPKAAPNKAPKAKSNGAPKIKFGHEPGNRRIADLPNGGKALIAKGFRDFRAAILDHDRKGGAIIEKSGFKNVTEAKKWVAENHAATRQVDAKPPVQSALERAIAASNERAAEQQRIADGTKKIGDTHVPKASAPEIPGKAFTDAMTARAKVNAKGAMNMMVRVNGKESMSRKDLVESRVKAGAKVEGNRLVNPDGTFLEEKAITKTGLKYAEHLAKGGAAKLGIAAMIAAPAAAALVAYDATKRTASAAGTKDIKATAEAGKAAILAGVTTAGIGYAAMKTIEVGARAISTIGPTAAKVVGRAVPGLGVGLMAYGAYEGYKAHGFKGALLGSVGADAILDIPSAPAKPDNGQQRRGAGFNQANANYKAMQKANSDAGAGPRGWANPTVQAAAQAARGHTFSGFKR